MGPKRKELLKPGKPKGKLKAPEPQTENDFLEVADEHEQAAGKWRAGDAAKATRFFNRAIDTYNEGLKRHPKSFDLAYNKSVITTWGSPRLRADEAQSKSRVQSHRG